MSLTRTIAALAAVATLALSGCGGDDDGGSTDSPPESASESTSESTSETTDEPTEMPSEDASASAPEIDCSGDSAGAMGEVLGAPVTAEPVPGGGCNFTQKNPRAPSVSVNVVTTGDFAGGFEGVRTGVTSVIDGEVEDLEGIGDDAFVVVGPAPGGTASAGAGAVLLGETVVQVTLFQSVDLGADEVKQLTVDVLTMIGSTD